LKRAVLKFYSAKQRFAAKNERIRRVFPNSAISPTTILLAVVICLLGCIFCIAHTKTDRQIPLLSSMNSLQSTIAAEADAPSIEHQVSSIEHRVYRESGVEQPDEWQTVRMRVTAYCPCEKCCGEYSDGVTACGHVINPGDAFAAADRQYPFGTEMIVAGYNNDQPIKVLDRGGAIRGDRLDLFFHTHEEALQWGVKYVDVKVHRK
jgi:3D (Asp-Asp-Asp) domain-containing protein